MKTAYNPVTGKTESATRRALKVDLELPIRSEYGDLIARFLNSGE